MAVDEVDLTGSQSVIGEGGDLFLYVSYPFSVWHLREYIKTEVDPTKEKVKLKDINE